MSEVFTNLARSTLASGLVASGVGSDSLTVQSGDGSDLFPVLGLAGPDNFRCVLFKKSTGDIEIINVTETANDVFTITRAQESIGNIPATAFAFDAGDIIEHRPTSAFYTALSVGASSTNIQHGTFLYAVDTGAADAYVVAMNPTAITIADGQEVRVKITNTNTGIAATLKLDGITAVPITMEGGGNPPAGTIKAGFVHTFIYDGTSFIFQSQGLALTSTGFNALGKQIKNVAAGTAASDVATIGGTETLTGKTLTSPVINNPVINSSTGRVLATTWITSAPVVINTITAGWTTSSSTDLESNNAVAAYVRIRGFSGLSNILQLAVRKTGSGLSANTVEFFEMAAETGIQWKHSAYIWVELDSNSKFDAFIDYTVSGSLTAHVWGYMTVID